MEENNKEINNKENKVVAYHIDSIPDGMTLSDVLEVYYTTKVLVYERHRPYYLDPNNLDEDIVIVNPRKKYEESI